MEGSRPYLEEKGLAEIHDIDTADKLVSNVSLSGGLLIGKGIRKVRRDDPIIEQFLSAIPHLCGQQVPCGLLWHKGLYPSNGFYDPEVHYLRTNQAAQKSAHGLIEFYRDQTTQASFAIKVLQKKDAFHAEEVRSRLRLQHENIADVYGVIVRLGTVHILMEHAGRPLVEERAWFAESPDRMLQFGKQAFRALKFLHVKGYVHCDIKPDNLMVVRDGNSFILKVIDFGTCRQIEELLPPQAHTTWQYWPPELWEAREKKEKFLAEASVDVYAMALTLYFVQMGSHLMLKIPQEAMITQPEYVKMMGIPESIPPELRVVMNHCLEVNKVRRSTAEEAAARLMETEPVHQGCSSSKEKYLANLSSIASGDGSQRPFIDNLIEQSGSSKSQLARVSVGGNKILFQKDVTRGPEAVRFERKTSKIFQELKKIEDKKSRSKSATRTPPELGESSRNVHQGLPISHQVENRGTTTTPYGSEMYPYASLLEQFAQQFKTQPQNSLCSTQSQITEIPTASQEIPQTLGKFGKTKAFSSISRQKNRAKVRQKSYDRNLNTSKNPGRKFSAGSIEPKMSPKVASPSVTVTQAETQKLWPLSEMAQDIQEQSYPFSNTKEDDMDCVIDVFDPEAFQMNNEDDITDYMFELVEKQENEEGPERIRLDMDGMSLSGPEINRQEPVEGKSTDNEEMGIFHKSKSSDTDNTTNGIPNFDLLS